MQLKRARLFLAEKSPRLNLPLTLKFALILEWQSQRVKCHFRILEPSLFIGDDAEQSLPGILLV